MEEGSQNKFDLRNYLLGRHDADLPEIEEKLITDQAFFQELLIEEEELTQDYVDGHLSDSDRNAFESHFLISDDRRKNVRFAQAFRNSLNARSESEVLSGSDDKQPVSTAAPFFGNGFTSRFGIKTAIVGFAVLFAAIFLGILFFNSGTLQQNPLEREFAKLNQSGFTDLSKFRNITHINLMPGVSRGSENNDEILADKITDKVMFRLGFPSGLDSGVTFRFKLFKDNEVVFTQEQIRVISNKSGMEIRLLIPSSVLARGKYKIIAKNIADTSQRFTYTFLIR